MCVENKDTTSLEKITGWKIESCMPHWYLLELEFEGKHKSDKDDMSFEGWLSV